MQFEIHPDSLPLLECISSLKTDVEASEGVDKDDDLVSLSSSSPFSIAGLEVSFNETPRSSTSGSSASHASSVDAIELPSSDRAVELDAKQVPSPDLLYHSPTLRELEGGNPEYVAELAGRKVTEPSPSRPSSPSRRISRMRPQAASTTHLPCQEEFFFEWVETCSRTRPAPVGDCILCHNSLQLPNKLTIRLTCGHHVHQECLVSNFRVLDYEFGNCPVCGMALCERTLHDRIDTDRIAIFGQSFTNLLSEERIDFAQHDQMVICWSEEEVAAAQLRLMKDYIDSHADELYRQWREKSGEPDWLGAVVIPAVRLFRGWNVQKHGCKYFADHDAFYKLVVWAELVRLMNTIRDGVKQVLQDVPFPELNGLHRSLMFAKHRYEAEKRTWSLNRSGTLQCEKVAQDAFSMAVSTHVGPRR